MRPRARRDGLIVQRVEGETLVYDRARDRAHCLGELMAEIWRRSDGTADAAAIAAAVTDATGRRLEASSVELAWRRLARASLLEPEGVGEVRGARGTRRQLLRRGAAVAGLTLLTITAPTPGQAATCVPNGGCCNRNADCCSNHCDNSTPCPNPVGNRTKTCRTP